MKTKIAMLFTALICTSLMLSCASTPQTAGIDVNDLIGTKWITVIPFLGVTNSLEFINENTAIYTMATGPREVSYSIRGNNLIMGRDTYTLNETGKVFIYKGNPYFVEENYARELLEQHR